MTAAFNTTDAHHTYRIERAAGGVGAALRVDGVLRAELPALGPAEGSGGLVYFGDPTYWANSESYTSSVRYATANLGVEHPGSFGLLWARPLGCPSTVLGLAYRAESAGMLSIEIFDSAGRRIAGAGHDVVAGEGGNFEAQGAHPAGLYLYRVRLAVRTGGGSQVTGRIVVAR